MDPQRRAAHPHAGWRRAGKVLIDGRIALRIDGARATLVGRGDRVEVRTVSLPMLFRLRTARGRWPRLIASVERMGMNLRVVYFGVPVARL